MKVVRSISEMQKISSDWTKKGWTVGFIPTMGALHAGHLSLVNRSRAENEITVASIFVNPLQFGPKEDFKRYPRTEKQDLRWLKSAGCDVVFMPKAESFTRSDGQTVVHVAEVASLWEGRQRPGHFDGVATIVAKLFNVIRPNRSYFGEKDIQQLRVVQRMASDLNFPVRIIPCPTVREEDGLAMSSRNRYLSSRDREEAIKIYQALYLGRELVEKRIMTEAARLIKRLTVVLMTIPKAKIEYIAVVDPLTLEPQTTIKRPVLLAMAVRLGKTRLIDNVIVP
jgi:pantoate--beta-alanine ligase